MVERANRPLTQSSPLQPQPPRNLSQNPSNMLPDSSSDRSYEFPMPSKPFEVPVVVRKRRARSATRPRSTTPNSGQRPHTSPIEEARLIGSFGSGSSSSSSALHGVATDRETEQRRHSSDDRSPVSFTLSRPRWDGADKSSISGFEGASGRTREASSSLYPDFRKAPTYRSGFSAPREYSYPSQSIFADVAIPDEDDTPFEDRSESPFPTPSTGKKRRFSRSTFLHCPNKDQEKSELAIIKNETSSYNEDYT